MVRHTSIPGGSWVATTVVLLLAGDHAGFDDEDLNGADYDHESCP